MDKHSGMLLSYAWKMLLISLVIIGLCSGIYYFYFLFPIPGADHFTVTITEVSLCPDENAQPKFEEGIIVFPRDVASISICGQLQVNDPPIYMAVDWYYKDVSNHIFREVVSSVNQPHYSFKSTLKPNGETFEPGRYGVEFIIGVAIVWKVEFLVE